MRKGENGDLRELETSRVEFRAWAWPPRCQSRDRRLSSSWTRDTPRSRFLVPAATSGVCINARFMRILEGTQQCLIAVRRWVATVSGPKMVEDTQTDHSKKLIISRLKELATNSVANQAREHTDSERKGPSHSFLCAQTHSGPLF